MSIPKLIHFAWTGLPGRDAPPMPEWAIDNISRFVALNPGYQVVVHGEEALLSKYREWYAQSANFAHTSDLLRYSILQAEGGWWFDVDIYPFRPVADIERSYCLDGSRLFITEQHGQLSTQLLHNGAIMAAGPNCVTWPAIDNALKALEWPPHRIATGPGLLTALVKAEPGLFEVASWPWFYPAAFGRAGWLHEMFRAQGNARARFVAPTAGQMPFTMHLWSGEKSEIRKKAGPAVMAHYDPSAAGPYAGRYACVAPDRVQWTASEVCRPPFEAIVKGLAELGFAVDVSDCAEAAEDAMFYDLVILWNGRKKHHKPLADAARRNQVPMLILELGFFDRKRHWQCDTKGILHWANWLSELRHPAPPEGAERLARVWPHELHSYAKRMGYVLVLGQVEGDSQLADCEIQSTNILAKMVFRTVQRGDVAAVYRRHPASGKVQRQQKWLPDCQGGSLEEAVAGARFAVTINSNAAHECMALGCPVMAFGPAVYTETPGPRIAKRTSSATFANDFSEMLAGWRPDPEAVRNHLEWLACRQWAIEDWQDGKTLHSLVEEAMA